MMASTPLLTRVAPLVPQEVAERMPHPQPDQNAHHCGLLVGYTGGWPSSHQAGSAITRAPGDEAAEHGELGRLLRPPVPAAPGNPPGPGQKQTLAPAVNPPGIPAHSSVRPSKWDDGRPSTAQQAPQRWVGLKRPSSRSWIRVT